jgi:hypothetical protein
MGRVPQTSEPYWLDTDRQKVLERQADLRDHCGSCGQRRSDWLDERGKELRDPPFEMAEILCPACEMRDSHVADMRDRDKDLPPRHGIHLAFRRLPEEPEEDDSAVPPAGDEALD